MKLSIFLFPLLFVCLSSAQKTEKQISKVSDASEQVNFVQTSDFETTFLYVIAPSGLSLRKEDDVASEKLASMPLGSQVTLIDSPVATDMIVEHIEGAMLEINYNGQTGFAFSGYLAPIRLLKKEEAVEDYIAALKKSHPNINYESKSNDPDFHEGITDTYVLPVSHWHEAYYIVSAMYKIPKSLGFPNPEGPVQSVIEDPKKPADVWDSFLTTQRENNTIKMIEYDYRVEGSGYQLDIIRKSQNEFLITYLVFVD